MRMLDSNTGSCAHHFRPSCELLRADGESVILEGLIRFVGLEARQGL